MNGLKLGLLFSRIREEEKLLIREATDRGIEIQRIDSRGSRIWLG